MVVVTMLLLAGGSIFSCGGQAQLEEGDGAPSGKDAARDGTQGQEAGADHPSDTSEAGVDGASNDEDISDAVVVDIGPDAFPQPSIHHADLDACTPYVCHAGQLCVSYIGPCSVQAAQCTSAPAACDGKSECECLVQAASSWCKKPQCSQDGGEIMLLCTEPPVSP
jgi:hypothetical protein